MGQPPLCGTLLLFARLVFVIDHAASDVALATKTRDVKPLIFSILLIYQ